MSFSVVILEIVRVHLQKTLQIAILLTGRHLVVMGSRAVAEYVFHLQKLICAVTSDDGESKSLGALLQRCVVHFPLQLAGVRSEARRTSLTYAQSVHGSTRV